MNTKQLIKFSDSKEKEFSGWVEFGFNLSDVRMYFVSPDPETYNTNNKEFYVVVLFNDGYERILQMTKPLLRALRSEFKRRDTMHITTYKSSMKMLEA